jgi:branched-subunit amino acid ABC-type transport system permease component
MSTLLPFLIAGVAQGSVFGLAALGLVVTYKTSGIFNFGHGAIAAIGAYVFYDLRTIHHWPWPIAALVCLLVLAPVLGILQERLAAGLAPVRLAMKVVATVGVVLLVAGITSLHYGASSLDFPPFLPQETLRVLGVQISAAQLITFVLSIVVAGALYALFRLTKIGVAMRGVVDDPTLMGLTGVSPIRVRRAAWIIGSTLAVASGILLAPFTGLDTIQLTLLVVQSFGAAAIGRFTSLPLTFAGGLFIGVAENLLVRFSVDVTWLSLAQPALPFVVLFVVLLLSKPAVIADAGRLRRVTGGSRPTLPASVQRGLAVVALVVAVFLPSLVGVRIQAYSSGLVSATVFLSLGLLVWTSGQVSLCHAGFVAVGATTTGHLLAHGVPWVAAVLVAGLVVVPLGFIIAVPAMRLSGIYLALATLGFGVLLQYLLYNRSFMFGQLGQLAVPRPDASWLGIDPNSDTAYYYVTLVGFLVATVIVYGVLRLRLGRLLRALSDSPLALAMHGAPVNKIRLLVYGISAFMAGAAGGLSGALAGTASSAAYSYFSSLTLLAVLALYGTRVGVVPALSAGIALSVIPSYLTSVRGEWFTILFGASAIGAALLSDRGSGGLRLAPGLQQRITDRLATSPLRVRTLRS